MIWRTTFYGFTSTTDLARYSIRKYRTSTGWAYVLRINGSAETSPAVPFASLKAAKSRATALEAGRQALEATV